MPAEQLEATERAKAVILNRGEAGTRKIAADLGQPVRQTRGVLLTLVRAGAVETVRRVAGGRTRLFYRAA